MTEQAITAVKSLDSDAGRVGGYLLIWGNPQQRDLHGEYFTKDTDLVLDLFDQRPVLYHHGLDGMLKAAVIGQIDHLHADETGIWAEAQLDLHKTYVRAVQTLVDKGALHWSSGSLAHLVQVEADGHIKQWPLVEGSLTPSPAEPRRTNVQALKSVYADLGWTLPEQFQSNQTNNNKNNDEGETSMMNHMRKQLPLAEQSDALKAAPISVGSEFDTLNAADMLHGMMLLQATKHFRGVSERYANALAYKIRREGLSAIKADELSHTAQSDYGADWVPELWSSQIWNKARQDNVILPLFQSIEMPSNPFQLPVEGTDPTVYYVDETTNESHLSLGSGNTIPDSKVGSGKVTLNAKKLALRVGFSSELVEDSILPVLNLYREQAMRAIADSIDNVLLNGDMTASATGNINSDHTTPASGSVFLAMDGLRHLPIVTTTANAIDMGNAAPTLAKLREARFAMAYKYAARPSDLAWIVDGGTYAALLGLDEFLTMDKAGSLATAQTGQIGFLDGIPVFVSSEMPMTEADGKVGGGSNSQGTALCVYRPGWFVGYRRRIAVNVDYLPYYDSYQLTATVRVAFANFDDDVASMLYNVAV
ncbi:MAG: phage major capsid protein [Aggregatilineales bacterium]